MNKTMLLAGMEAQFPREFADSAVDSLRNVVVTVPFKGSTGKKIISDSICAYEWNKISPVSSHALMLRCESDFKKIDEAVLYFDESVYAAAFPEFTERNCSVVLNEMVAGYQYLTIELVKRFKINFSESPCTLVFVQKSLRHKDYSAKENPAVCAAAASFASFAQSTAALFFNDSFVNTLLVHFDETSENSTEGSIAKWLCAYLDSSAYQKTKRSLHQVLSWIKPGAKSPFKWFL